ncbi:hypothetical protein D3C71_1867100 [compost metagenome]
MLQVGRSVLVWWRAHGDELQHPVRYGLVGVGGEFQAAGARVAQHYVEQAGLVNG